MVEKLTGLADYFRKIPAAFLVAILSALGLIVFLPQQFTTLVAVDDFQSQYRVYLGTAFLLISSFCAARIYMFFMKSYAARKSLQQKHELLHQLTPEEKGYLAFYVLNQRNSVYVGMDDGVMAGLRAKEITYLAASIGDLLNGFAFNLQPWARKYLESNPHLLEGYVEQPMTPRQKLQARW